MAGALKEALLMSKYKRLQQVTGFQLEALETALMETKIRMNQEKERLEMRINEMESARMNQVVDEKSADALVKQFGGG